MKLLWGVLFCCVLLVALWFGRVDQLSDEEPHLNGSIPVYAVTSRIHDLAQRYVIGSNNSGSFPQGWNQPAIFKGTDVTKWLALKILPQERFWQDHFEYVPNVGVSTSGVFSFFKRDRPLSHLVRRDESFFDLETPSVRNMSVSEFFRLWKSSSTSGGGARVAFSEVLHRLPVKTNPMDTIWPLFAPHHSLLLDDRQPSDPPSLFDSNHSTSASLRLWVSSSHSRTLAHHDFSHNFYAVLLGQKNVILCPPASLPLFPFLHPHGTKVNLNIRSQRSTLTHPLPSTCARASLLPGDVLYIPPFWIHDFVSMGPTIALAVWSPSRDDALSTRLIEMGIPTAPKSSSSLRSSLSLLFVWISVLLDAPPRGVGTSRSTLHALLTSRYRHLIQSDQLPLNHNWMNHHCPEPLSGPQRLRRAREDIAQDMLSNALFLVSRMQEGRDVLMQNYMELVINQAVQQKAELITSVLTCFDKWLL